MSRRGISLVELLAVMAATTVVMAVAAELLHRAMTLQSLSRRMLERERTIFAVGRQFRSDVRASVAVTAGTGDEAIVTLVQADGATVTWRPTDEGLRRLAADPAGRRRREDYRLADSGEAPGWRATVAGGLVTLATLPAEARSIPPDRSGRPVRRAPRMEIVARINPRTAPSEGGR
jgi:type II secretory pathway pseudopilin PulG